MLDFEDPLSRKNGREPSAIILRMVVQLHLSNSDASGIVKYCWINLHSSIDSIRERRDAISSFRTKALSASNQKSFNCLYGIFMYHPWDSSTFRNKIYKFISTKVIKVKWSKVGVIV